MDYVYSFSVWPDPEWGFKENTHGWFKIATCRAEMQFTESEFEQFKSDMAADGLLLMEVERWPYIAPEAVS